MSQRYVSEESSWARAQKGASKVVEKAPAALTQPGATAPQAVVPCPDTPMPEKNAQPQPHARDDGFTELVAWRSPVRNERLLVCYRPGADPTNPLALVSVLVRSNRNFLAGMKVKVRQVTEQSFELVGPCPRWRGRW